MISNTKAARSTSNANPDETERCLQPFFFSTQL